MTRPELHDPTEVYVDDGYLEAHRAGKLIPHGNYDHLAVTVAVGDQVAWIDKGVAELIHVMWQLGIRTDESCEDVLDDGWEVLISFESPDDLSLFLSLGVPEDGVPGGLWDRVTGSNHAPGSAGAWEYQTFPKIEGRKVRVGIAAIFPSTDVPVLTERLVGQRAAVLAALTQGTVSG